MKHFPIIQAEFLKIANDNLNGEVHKEIEKRIQLEKMPTECNDIKPTLIKQGMLKEVRDDNDKMISYVRVRLKKEDGKNVVYSLGVKNFPMKQEVEIEISKEMFDSFFPNNLSKPQTKYRYSLPNGWEVDVVEGTDEIYAEYEHGKNEKVEIPKNWKVIND